MRRFILCLLPLVLAVGCTSVTPEQAVNYDQFLTNVVTLLPHAELELQTELAAATAANDEAKIDEISSKLMVAKLTPSLGVLIGEWFLKNVDKDKFDAEKKRRAEAATAGAASGGGE